MRTPITYYGGKQTMVKKILSMMPEHEMYVEPFFGGGSVFFGKNKERSKLEVINDHNEKLMSFYATLQEYPEELKCMVQNTFHSEKLHLIAKDIYYRREESNQLLMAWSIWLMSHTSFNGSFTGGWRWCNGTAGTNVAKVLAKKRNEISDKLFNRIKDVQISSRDALRVIIDRDSKDTFFYLDPPYPGAYQGHYLGYSMNEFIELLKLLSTIKGKFILSNYWSQSLRYYINKNEWYYEKKIMHLGTNVNKDRIRTQTRKKTKKEEVLIMNFIPTRQSKLKL